MESASLFAELFETEEKKPVANKPVPSLLRRLEDQQKEIEKLQKELTQRPTWDDIKNEIAKTSAQKTNIENNESSLLAIDIIDLKENQERLERMIDRGHELYRDKFKKIAEILTSFNNELTRLKTVWTSIKEIFSTF